MKLIPILACVMLTAACTTTQVPPAPVLVPEKQSLNIDPKLIASCAPLQHLDPTKVYGEQDQVSAIGGWANQYDDCSKRFAGFVALVTPLLRINQPSVSASK